VPETSRRRGRGQRNGSEPFGHGRNSDRSPLPRRFSLPESAARLPPLDPEFCAEEQIPEDECADFNVRKAVVDKVIRIYDTHGAKQIFDPR
jgi:hypothetical protein